MNICKLSTCVKDFCSRVDCREWKELKFDDINIQVAFNHMRISCDGQEIILSRSNIYDNGHVIRGIAIILETVDISDELFDFFKELRFRHSRNVMKKVHIY